MAQEIKNDTPMFEGSDDNKKQTVTAASENGGSSACDNMAEGDFDALGEIAPEEVIEEIADGADEDDADVPDIPLSALDLEDEINHTHTSREKKSRKKFWTLFLFLAVNVIVIVITALFEFNGEKDDGSLGDITRSISANWYFLLGAAGCVVLVYTLQALKISSTIKVMTGHYRLRASYNTAILGKYYDYITPLAVGGQPFQIYYLTKSKVPAGVATAAPIVQWFLNSLAYLILCILSFVFFGHAVDSGFIKICAYIGVSLNALMPVTVILFSCMPKVTVKIVTTFLKLLAKLHIVKNYDETAAKAIKTVSDYRESIASMWKSKGAILIGFILSLLERLAEASVTYFVLMACFNGNTDGYLVVTATTLFVTASSCFVPTPGTAGASEGVFYIVFQSFWPMFIWRLFSYYVYLLVGFILILRNTVRHGNKKKKEAKTA